MSDELERIAAEAGLERAMTEDRAAVEKALEAAKKLKADMSREFALSDEPAHIFHAQREGAGR